jgi:penicillin-binding protein 1A
MAPRRLAALVAALLVALTAIAGCSYEPPDVAPEIPANAESSAIYAADGTLITIFHAVENRQEVPLERMPEVLRDAVVAIEDERFWDHKGVDLRAVLRALGTNAAEGEIAEGASTITMQVVKNTLTGGADTLEAKVREAALAFELERNYTKEFILELYLNTIYFGNGAYGVQAAAHQYFGKPVDQIGLAEAALLAGMIQSPNRFDPFDFPQEATARRDVVLGRMLDLGWITAADHAAAVATALTLAPPPDPSARYPAAHFVEEVKQWILDDPRFGATPAERQNLLFAGGLRIHTTIDLRMQAAAEAAVAAVLPDPTAYPEAGLVAVAPLTGFVRAMVGGRDFFGGGAQAKYNLAMGKGRPTGSSFKPLVLAAALSHGIPLSTTFTAPPRISLAFAENQMWDVDNYGEGGSEAPVDLVEATVRSYNTAYAQLILAVGPEDAVETATAMGIQVPLQAVPSAVLGANDVRVIDMASAYATLASRGVAVAPVMVSRITRSDGTLLYQHHHAQTRAIPTAVADQVTSVLEQVIGRGTGTAAAIGRPAAGKTGTGQRWTDAWFCGYTPQLAAAVWVGFPQEAVPMVPPTTSIRVTGGSWPARIWQRFMAEAMAPMPVVPFVAPGTPAPAPPAPVAPAAPPPPAAPVATVPPVVATVPYVVGMASGDAVATLQASGTVARVLGPDGSTPTEGGTVVSQWPPGGRQVAAGSTVTVTVRS